MSRLRSRVRFYPRGPRPPIDVEVEHNELAVGVHIVEMARDEIGLDPSQFSRGEVVS